MDGTHTIGADPTRPIGNKNPPKATQFGGPDANPRGHKWRKEDSPRYKLEKMITMTREELDEVIESPDTPVFESKLATAIIKADWTTIEHMINQVYGTPLQRVEGAITKPVPLIPLEKMKAQKAAKVEHDS